MFNNETFWTYASMWHLNVFRSLCQSANLVGVLTCCTAILSKIRLLGRNTYHTYRTVTYHVTANEQLLQTSGTLSVQVSFRGELGIKLKIGQNTRHKDVRAELSTFYAKQDGCCAVCFMFFSRPQNIGAQVSSCMLSSCQVQKNEAHIVPGPPQTDRKNIWKYAKIVVSVILCLRKRSENRNAISRRWWCKTYCFLRSHVYFRSKTGEPYENMRTAAWYVVFL